MCRFASTSNVNSLTYTNCILTSTLKVVSEIFVSSVDLFSLEEPSRLSALGDPVLLWLAAELEIGRPHSVQVVLIEEGPPIDRDLKDHIRGITIDHITITRPRSDWV